MTGNSDREELYRRLQQSRRLASGAHDQLTQQRLQALVEDLEGKLAAAEAQDTDAPPALEAVMTTDCKTLKRKLDEATTAWREADLKAKEALAEKVRELERLFELAASENPNAPQ